MRLEIFFCTGPIGLIRPIGYRPYWTYRTYNKSKDPGPEDPALISPQRGGVYLRLRME
ncbi:hypothetical protein D1AOALGA4SA_12858 [Olavius algarvensis Delta 1 endosymbiont]|nr:hypothetical protein D1AOALGA4SA_12858 [Olavius algarvensis Delta 1 endosymbiont]